MHIFILMMALNILLHEDPRAIGSLIIYWACLASASVRPSSGELLTGWSPFRNEVEAVSAEEKYHELLQYNS